MKSPFNSVSSMSPDGIITSSSANNTAPLLYPDLFILFSCNIIVGIIIGLSEKIFQKNFVYL